jgi:amidase
MVTSADAPALQNYIPKHDANAVARLRQAGAILLGKTDVPIFSGDFQAYYSIYGTTNNPWNQDFSPGGSSGGAAAAIATGISALELGSDLAGSIRWPAHCCGIFGLKTTCNLVSTYGHIPPMPELRLARNPRSPCRGPARPRTLLSPSTSWPGRATLRSRRRFHPAIHGPEDCAWRSGSRFDATVAAAARKAAVMLEVAGAVINEPARPAFSFEEAWEVFAILTHALIGASLPDKTRDKLAAREHYFLTGDLSHRALQARGMRLSTPNFIGIQTRRARLR